MKYSRKIALSIVALCIAIVSQAQVAGDSIEIEGHLCGDPTVRSRMFAIGPAKILDTYLSAEQYSGVELRYVSQSVKPIRNNSWLQIVTHQGSFSSVENRAENHSELGGIYQFQYAQHYILRFSDRLRCEIGGAVGAHLGFLYNTYNGNNPAQMQAALQLRPSAAANYVFPLFKRSSILRYEVSAPLVGLMFSPNYGQSYYEIFGRGNYDHNIVPTTIVSTPSLSHLLTLDFPISRRKPQNKLRIGYLGDYRQAEVNNLKFHHYSHLIVIGWTKGF